MKIKKWKTQNEQQKSKNKKWYKRKTKSKIKTKYQNKKSKQNIIQNENKGIRVYLTDDRFALHLDDQTDGQSWIEDI